MKRLLRIDSSITQGNSITRQLSDHFVSRWLNHHPDTNVETLDLVKHQLPHFDNDSLVGMSLSPQIRTQAMQAASERRERLITQLERADILVIGCPMYNFTIPTQLKAWLDHVTLVGRTFRYTGPNRPEGLVVGKKVLVIAARGGDYSAPPVSSWDFQEPLLRTWLGFLGLVDLHFVRAEGLALDPARVPEILKRAEEHMVELLEHKLRYAPADITVDSAS